VQLFFETGFETKTTRPRTQFWNHIPALLGAMSRSRHENLVKKLQLTGLLYAGWYWDWDFRGGSRGCSLGAREPRFVLNKKLLLGIKLKNAFSLLLCLILYVPLIPTCEPLLNFFWIRPCSEYYAVISLLIIKLFYNSHLRSLDAENVIAGIILLLCVGEADVVWNCER